MRMLFQVRELIADCFVTGKWDKDEDAETKLQQDGIVWAVSSKKSGLN